MHFLAGFLSALFIGFAAYAAAGSPAQSDLGSMQLPHPTGRLWVANFGGNGTNFGNPLLFDLPIGDPSAPNHPVVPCVGFIVNANGLAGNYSLVVLDRALGQSLWEAPITTIGFPGWLDFGVVPVPTTGGWSLMPLLFAGTSSGIAAFDALSGSPRWTHEHGNNNATPARPTYAAGRVYYTYENGHHSSPVTALNASDGRFLFSTGRDERAITLIWVVREVSAVAYCSYNESGNSVSVTVRNFDGSLRWQHSGLQWSPPGLWDNPNLDVDAEGRRIFMYSKPHLGQRNITCFNSTTGEMMWVTGNSGSITDYDTYAWRGNFYRLMTVVGSNLTQMVVQKLAGESGEPVWTTTFACSDPGSILLVQGDGVFVFGLTTNIIWAFDASGNPLWLLPGIYMPDNGQADPQNRLLFGDGIGNFHAIDWRKY